MNEHPLLSIVITSYTMERFKDICDLFDSIKNQTLMEIHRDLEIYRDSVEISGDSMETRSSNLNQSLPISTSSPIEVIFVAERSRGLYEKVRKRFLFERKVKQGGKGNGFEGSDPEGDRDGSRIPAERNPGLYKIFEGEEGGDGDGGYERIFA